MIETFGSSLEVFSDLRLSSLIFVQCSQTLVWHSGKFWRIFENPQKVAESPRKIAKNVYIYCENFI